METTQHYRYLSAERGDKVDPCISRFLSFLVVEKGASANTVCAYRYDLEQMEAFLREYLAKGRYRPDNGGNGRKAKSIPWRRVDRTIILDFILELKRRRYSETSIARKVAAVRSFFTFLRDEGEIQQLPTEGIASPRIGRPLPKAITREQVSELLEQPLLRPTPEGRRDLAMLELLCASGMRVSELVSLNVSSLHLSSNGSFVRCLGKGSRERTIPIHQHAAAALQEYLDEGRPYLVGNRNEPALFVNRRGERLTRQGFWLILKQHAKAAKLNTRVTPHTLRHTFATHMLRQGAPLRSVQELLGHANISSTQVYTHLTDEHLREVYDKAHPRAR